MRFAIVTTSQSAANEHLASRGSGWEILAPEEAARTLRPGDVVLGRIDVKSTLDGIEPGLWALDALEARGVTVLNSARCLLTCHDKLLTAVALDRASVPHPRTTPIQRDRPSGRLRPPVVIKPRFGSWGGGVCRCLSDWETTEHLESIRCEPWFHAGGAVMQKLVPPGGYDLRLVVAAGRVVGAIQRVCADNEWRTNVALGAQRVPTIAPHDAIALALRAASAVGGALVGVDLLPDGSDWIVLEVNGAVEFSAEYNLEKDVFELASEALLALAATHALS